MNAPVLASRWSKERFTVAQIWALVEKGLLLENAKFELVDGEVVPMSPKGPLHEDVRYLVNRWLGRMPSHLGHIAETTLYLDERNFVEPDFIVFRDGLAMADLKPSDVELVIEVAHESWAYDVGDKADRYAFHGVHEYWVIHAPKRTIRVHRGPGVEGWTDVSEIPAGMQVAPLCAPDLLFRLERA